MIPIANFTAADDLDALRAMLREYEAEIGVDLCFQSFAAELASLPGDYAPPRGRLLLAYANGALAGCVALKPVDEATCEMKRLYVRPAHRASGLGRDLVTRVIAEARALGFREMRLDTLPSMQQAQRMYERFGFRDIPPYRPNPVPGTRYMGLAL